ncbi:hypothetical protein [Roseateles puraquae]|jgi:hypothetical protein|nr:hypothetical protein [Roseateles puraquae]MDG0854783.1 hypothetical protein [Roseateles puraquae]
MTNPELPDPNDGWGEPWPGMGEPAQTPPCDIAPLERFVTPPGLDGSAGAHRCAEHCLIGVDNDLAAIDWWVTQASSHETTAHSRRAVADKLLNWACFVKGKAVSSLDEQDFAEFARFLAHPQPLQRWVGARVSRTSMRWRPFAKPLVGSSRDNALRQVAALVHWLFEQRYADLRFSYGKTAMDDGTATVAVKGAARRFTPLGTVTPEEWHWIRRTLDLHFPAEHLAPRRFIVELLYYGNLRAEEIATLSPGDLEPPNRQVADWSIRLHQRLSSRVGEVVVCPPPLSDTVRRWMRQRETPSQGHVVFRIREASATLIGLSGDRISALGRQVLKMAAALAAERGDIETAERLRSRSLVHLRGAFDVHRCGRVIDRAAIELTGRGVEYGLDMGFRMPEPSDWRNAAHLWTEGPDDDAQAQPVSNPVGSPLGGA